MKILLIHPEDDPEKGPWSSLAWDQIVDLGLGGLNQYANWSSQFHCRVTSLHSLRNGFEDFRRIRSLLGMGYGRLQDDHGLDWWEIQSIRLAGELETLILLQRLVQTLSSRDEIYISRPGMHASFLQCLRNGRLEIFRLRSGADRKRLGHYIQLRNRLSASQMLEIFWDKYDAGYQLRGHFTKKRQPSPRPIVLLPTAYVNVSRTGIAYAKTFADEDFLLVTTRRSGWVNDPPKNVTVARLSSYASLRDRNHEVAEIEHRCRLLLKELSDVPEFEILVRSECLHGFYRHFGRGLEFRDAWRSVLDTEPVEAVLCADDSNPYTSIPLRLARNRGISSIACHHGALDGRYVFKRQCADVIWAKGKMEEDYLVRKCGVPAEGVEIGAPLLPVRWNASGDSEANTFRPFLLFISEAFDVSEGRAQGFYQDILPPLADLALNTGRALVVKLHPAESERERGSLLNRILSPRQKSCARIVSGPLTEDLLAKAWIGVTIHSTVAMECAIRGIPCFLCRWLESWPYGYAEQFIRFGVGIGLNHPNEINSIPDRLQHYPIGPEVRENCWRLVSSGRLRELITSQKVFHEKFALRGASGF